MKAVEKLPSQTGRKIRLGTPLELLAFSALYSQQKNGVSLVKCWDDVFLGWNERFGFTEFQLFSGGDRKWSDKFEIFIVEDL